MKLLHRTFEFQFSHPAPIEPEWKNLVDRWYQLDAAAYGLSEFYDRNREALGPKPDLILLASPSASNETDRNFVKGGAQSPAKFVHTLPNIRISPLCQVMGWNGPVYCIQNGKKTWETAVEESKFLIGENCRRIWILSVNASQVTAQVSWSETT